MDTRNGIGLLGSDRRRLRRAVRATALVGLLFASLSCGAGGGPLGIDHMLPYDDSGIWNRR